MLRPGWEYHTVANYRHLEDRELAELGADGWELVTVTALLNPAGRENPRYIFKRLAEREYV